MKLLKMSAIFILDLVPLSDEETARIGAIIPGTLSGGFLEDIAGLQAYLKQVHDSNATEDRLSEPSSSSIVFPATMLPQYLLARLHGQSCYILNRKGSCCRIRVKPFSFFWDRFYYSILQFILLPFIRLGIPVRDSFIRWKRYYRRGLDLIGAGRKRSQKFHVIGWTIIRKVALFSYYRIVMIWRKVRVLGSALLYLLLIFPGALLILLAIYVGCWIERIVRQRS